MLESFDIKYCYLCVKLVLCLSEFMSLYRQTLSLQLENVFDVTASFIKFVFSVLSNVFINSIGLIRIYIYILLYNRSYGEER